MGENARAHPILSGFPRNSGARIKAKVEVEVALAHPSLATDRTKLEIPKITMLFSSAMCDEC
jgi:hypothetical protein